jgi:hypothetical protein
MRCLRCLERSGEARLRGSHRTSGKEAAYQQYGVHNIELDHCRELKMTVRGHCRVGYESNDSPVSTGRYWVSRIRHEHGKETLAGKHT